MSLGPEVLIHSVVCCSAEHSLGLCPRQMAERAMCEAGKVHPVSSTSQNCALLLTSTFELLFLSPNQTCLLEIMDTLAEQQRLMRALQTIISGI